MERNILKAKKSNKLIMFIIVLFIVVFVIIIHNYDEKNDPINNGYELVNVNTKISGKVLSSSKIVRGDFLKITTKNQKLLFKHSVNYLCSSDVQLSEFISVGDSIFKNKNNDSLFIYKSEISCLFLIKE